MSNLHMQMSGDVEYLYKACHFDWTPLAINLDVWILLECEPFKKYAWLLHIFKSKLPSGSKILVH